MDKKEIEHRFKEAEEISREYPFTPEDVFYVYRHFGWDKDNTETVLILALTHRVSPFEMIGMISHINTALEKTEGKRRRKKHIRIQQMKLKGLTGHDRDGLLFLFSYQYQFKDHSFNVFINRTNAQNLFRDMFNLDEIDIVRDSSKWEFFMARILKEVLTVFSRYPIKDIFTLEEFEAVGDSKSDLKGMEWKYDGEDEIELTKPGIFSFRV